MAQQRFMIFGRVRACTHAWVLVIGRNNRNCTNFCVSNVWHGHLGHVFHPLEARATN
jgi:hypothetical protein